jgi:hypothetical protein
VALAVWPTAHDEKFRGVIGGGISHYSVEPVRWPFQQGGSKTCIEHGPPATSAAGR